MVDDKVIAVVNAEAVATELAGVISGANPQETNDDVVCGRECESITASFSFLNANAVAGSGLSGNGDVRFADDEAFRFDYASDTEDDGTRTFGFDCIPQA